MITGAQAKPLAVWDAMDPDSAFWRHWPEASAWARAHLPDARSTWRAEFYLIDTPFALVFAYARDENGRVLHDFERDRPMQAMPETVTIDELPPERLWR